MKRTPKNPNFTLSIIGLIGLLTLLSACSQIPRTAHWHEQYSYLQNSRPQNKTITETDYYLVFLVAAHHLDYWDNKTLAHSLINYSGGKGGLGHSWIYLKGLKEGEPEVLEGGQSGQRGKIQPRHFTGINNYIKFGYANPTAAQKNKSRHEPNPIKYLWEEFQDGFFQPGSGGHQPTYAAKIDLTGDQYQQILKVLDPKQSVYTRYSLVSNQCSSFVKKIAQIAEFPIQDTVMVQIKPTVSVGDQVYHLWRDPQYATITFSTHDVIEKSLMQAVATGQAEYALDWYINK